jgi:phenylalanyl-tRNA synthetase beta chain
MATITFSSRDLEQKGLDIATLKDLVPRFGIAIEKISGDDIVFEITPNRPDLLDFVGFVRALLNFSGTRQPKENRYAIGNAPAMEIRVTHAVSGVRPFIAGIVVKGVDLTGNNLRYLINFTEKLCDTHGRKRKKFAVGLHNLDVISAPLTYDAARKEAFVPLGSNVKMSFERIIKEHAKGIEYSHTLEAGKNGTYPYLMDAKSNILSMIPIINSEFTRVTEKTKNLFVDITGTSRNGVDQAASMLACSFIDMGAEVYPCTVSYAKEKVVTPIMKYKDVKVGIFEIQRSIGAPVDQDKVVQLANRLGHVAAKYEKSLLARIAPYRIDVLNEQDVIEDIAIAYGYNKIVPIPVISMSHGLLEEKTEYAGRLAVVMVGLGFTEAMNMYLTNEKVNFDSMMRKYDANEAVRVSYSKTENMTMLRTNILHELLQNLGISKNERMPQRMFEIGSVFSVKGGKPVEGRHMAFVSEHSRANFSEIKAFTESAMKHMRIESHTIEDAHDSAFIEGRCAAIKVNGRTIGHFGELHPKVLENFGLEEPAVAAEIEL